MTHPCSFTALRRSLARSLAHAGTHGHKRIAMETDKRRAGPQREVIDKACEEMGRSAGSR